MSDLLTRAALCAALMLAASALAVAVKPRQHLAGEWPRGQLHDMVPRQFAGWREVTASVMVPMSPDLRQAVDQAYDDTLALAFRHDSGAYVMLALSYGRNQQGGRTMHSPELCYEAQGFRVQRQHALPALEFGGTPIPLTRLATTLGARTEPVSYWVLVGQRYSAFGLPLRLATLGYGLRGYIADGMLVRVSSIDTNDAAAFRRHDQFIADLLHALPPAALPRLLAQSA